MTTTKIIIANWKMNPRTLCEARELFSHTKRKAEKLSRVQTIVCPPAVFLGALGEKMRSAQCALGAQDLFYEEEGAYTGAVSGPQIVSSRARFVIVGHSELRMRGDTDILVNSKIKAALLSRLTSIVCVGERIRDDEGLYFSFLKHQIKDSLARIKSNEISRVIFAYEPVWAIGASAKRADTPDACLQTVIFIRKVLSDIFGRAAFRIPILYGGSVSPQNAGAFLTGGGVRGLLVGRASLSRESFNAILEIAERVKIHEY